MTIIKTLHILGACLFIGNIIVSGLWKALADRTAHVETLQFASRLINLTDLLFTASGAVLLVVTGHMLAANHGGVASQSWILVSYVLFALSGALWAIQLLPIQLQQAKLLKPLTADDAVPPRYYELAKRWAVIGTLATLLPLPAIYFMVGRTL